MVIKYGIQTKEVLMPFPELIWTAGGIIGGLLLIESLSLTTKGKVGIWIIFASFIFQVYWVITHPWIPGNSLPQVIVVSVILVVGLTMIWIGRRVKKNNRDTPVKG